MYQISEPSGDQAGWTQQPPLVSWRKTGAGVGVMVGDEVAVGTGVGELVGAGGGKVTARVAVGPLAGGVTAESWAGGRAQAARQTATNASASKGRLVIGGIGRAAGR
jgi:hypothetical protein